jgi:FkbM family methyltransferase
MKGYPSRDFIFFCCGLCAASTVGIGLWLYFIGWRHPVISATEPTRVPRIHLPSRSAGKQDHETVDLNTYLVDRNAFYQSLPAQYVKNNRLEEQVNLLEAYKKGPAMFLYRYTGAARLFLFDAVIDPTNMVRVGTFADGGKWMCDPQSFKAGAVVYSFGAGTEISFDTESAGLFGWEVHCFDPTPSVELAFANYRAGQRVGKGRFWYHPVGLAPVSLDPEKADDLVLEDRKCKVKHLNELAAELGHTHVDILKIDIEGGEMAALTEILSSGMLKKLAVKQLLVEFHLWDDKQWSSFVHIISSLRQQGYLIFRKEFNPEDGRCAEFSFLAQDENRPKTPQG